MDRVELARLLGASTAPGTEVRTVVVEERDPRNFMTGFAVAVAGASRVFLADPAWGEAERLVLKEALAQSDSQGLSSPRGWLMIPSGGTSGKVKFACHDDETLMAAVRGFCAHFNVTRVNSVGVLPLHHVSGLMAWMRSAATGGDYRPWDWKKLEAGERPEISKKIDRPVGDGWFISLVPTQLQRLIASPETVSWLRQFDAIFVGGGPVWPDLAQAAERERLPISLGYGMTETAAMVTALLPDQFLAGERSSGSALPHARIDLTQDGLVRISGESLFRGYFPDRNESREWVSEDLGRLEANGQLQILGRRDAVIITGGKKVDPLEVEAALRACGEFEDVAVVGLSDAEWGQSVVACYPQSQPAPNLEKVREGLAGMAAFKRPRSYRAVAPWPRNAQGKLNRSELVRLVVSKSHLA